MTGNQETFGAAVERHLAAVTGRDLDGYLATVHEDVSLVQLNGRIIAGRAAVGEFHKDWFEDPDWSWRLTPLHSNATGETGVALFAVDYHDLDQDGKPYSLRYLLGLTFARLDAGWLLVHDQNTPAPSTD
ncbi:uncharacterized protein (TIGR02246 family) [Actinoplanes tereljensis]|uniref:SnoaL-like domain-containing protein n=1 Tax=Paractinoplanes tereljensis TaxID=571912 RepID=A0A919NQ10_9ACTN|nr:nuclear transport factor 2 family protein [Actinoplanes tereljensis]GIF22568.1 hypothetical protein Ate02nite_52980 [Actinoplanes tereljensis]